MRENKQEFKVRDIVKLSKLPSELITNLFDECSIYLSKRILCYVLAQQINIQISTDKELSALRGYVGELEDYTFTQLVNFTDSHNIIIDTVDFKFRIWTVIFNNLEELGITHDILKKYLNSTEYRFEYASEIFKNLVRFVDEHNDIDGQPFIIARESLARFSNREEIISFGKGLDIYVPQKMSKEIFLEFLLHKLGDDTMSLREELNEMTLLELEEYAYNNYVSADASLTNKDIINSILDDYSPENYSITNIDYINYLQIPSLSKGFSEEEFSSIADLKPKKVLDESLKDIISTIRNGEASEKNEVLSEEESKEELEEVMNSLISGYNRKPSQGIPISEKPEATIQESLMIKRIDDLERRLNITEKNQVSSRESVLLRKIEELESRLSVTSDNKTVEYVENLDSYEENSKTNNVDQTEITKHENIFISDNINKGIIVESEEETETNDSEELKKETETNDLNVLVEEAKTVDSEELEEEAKSYDLNVLVDESVTNDSDDLDVDRLEKKLEETFSHTDTESDRLEETSNDDNVYNIDDLETQEDLSDQLLYELKEEVKTSDESEVNTYETESSFEEYIEEIHSAKGKKKIKARRRHSVKPVVVFWKAIAAWISVVGLVAIILVLYNYFNH
ncbi:hypothetical protein RJG79_06745 [Mycoplasmatota bacterium WC44]